MAKEGSVAPKERVNIVYKPATGDAMEEVELPLKLLLIGDYIGRKDARPLEDRKPINIDKDNFDAVLSSHDLEATMNVADKLTGEGEMSVKLAFKKLSDFGPEAVVNQVPELKKLLEVRAALTALKGPLGNVPAFRKKIQELLRDEGTRKKLLEELKVKTEG